jgi:hypothetical protein
MVADAPANAVDLDENAVVAALPEDKSCPLIQIRHRFAPSG